MDAIIFKKYITHFRLFSAAPATIMVDPLVIEGMCSLKRFGPKLRLDELLFCFVLDWISNGDSRLWEKVASWSRDPALADKEWVEISSSEEYTSASQM